MMGLIGYLSFVHAASDSMVNSSTLLRMKGGNAAVLDCIRVRFGLRVVETRGTEILLNGAPLKLLGFNRHDLVDSPVIWLHELKRRMEKGNADTKESARLWWLPLKVNLWKDKPQNPPRWWLTIHCWRMCNTWGSWAPTLSAERTMRKTSVFWIFVTSTDCWFGRILDSTDICQADRQLFSQAFFPFFLYLFFTYSSFSCHPFDAYWWVDRWLPASATAREINCCKHGVHEVVQIGLGTLYGFALKKAFHAMSHVAPSPGSAWMAKHGRRLCQSNLCEAKPSQLDADADEAKAGKGHDRQSFEQGFTVLLWSSMIFMTCICI